MKSWSFSRLRKQWIPGHFFLRPRGLGTKLQRYSQQSIDHCQPSPTNGKHLKLTTLSEVLLICCCWSKWVPITPMWSLWQCIISSGCIKIHGVCHDCLFSRSKCIHFLWLGVALFKQPTHDQVFFTNTESIQQVFYTHTTCVHLHKYDDNMYNDIIGGSMRNPH